MRWRSFDITSIFFTSFLLLNPTSSQQDAPLSWSNPDWFWSGPLRGPNEWGSWGVWSVCSRTCGGGASVRSRTCITRNPVGRPCPGEPRQYKICNIKSCPQGSVDFRTLQCQAFDHRPLVPGSSFTWKPFPSGSDPCILSCLAVGHMFYLNFGKVLDGTSCGSKPGSVCANGRCLTAGCDLVLGSGLTADACMICGGNNQSCLYHQQQYRPTGAVLGYSEVAMIPAGATHIRVTDNSRNYLVLQNRRAEYIINGDWTISRPGEYPVAGTKVLYKRSADLWESLELSGPTREDLHLMVLSSEPNAGLEFSYWLPLERYFLFHGPRSPQDHSPSTTSVTVAMPPSVSMAPKSAAIRPPRAKPPRQTSIRLKAWTRPEPGLDQKRSQRPQTIRPQTHMEARPDQDPLQSFDHRLCGACPRVRGRRERRLQFCSKDFVVRVQVLSARVWGSESRFEVRILESYRNRFPLLHREFVWAPDQCCPLLEPGRQYVLMLRRHVNHELTLNRIILEPHAYSALYRPQEDRQLRELQRSCSNTGLNQI